VLPDGERRIWEALGTGYTELDVLAVKAGLSIPETLAGITSLEMLGLIECASSGEIRRA
jgi:predicted Rossmann fold nucleotide-binding protein DprA/Smf involved in DNA uptake